MQHFYNEMNEKSQSFNLQSSTFLTSPGTIPNSSLKHLVKYDGAEKPTA